MSALREVSPNSLRPRMAKAQASMLKLRETISAIGNAVNMMRVTRTNVPRNFNMLACAFAIRGLKEFGDTSRKALIIGYSDPQRRGQMVGTYYLIRDLIVS